MAIKDHLIDTSLVKQANISSLIKDNSISTAALQKAMQFGDDQSIPAFPETDTSLFTPEQLKEYEAYRAEYTTAVQKYQIAKEVLTNPDYKTNPDSILTDHEARTGLGQVADTLLGVNKMALGLINSIATAPQKTIEQSDTLQAIEATSTEAIAQSDNPVVQALTAPLQMASNVLAAFKGVGDVSEKLFSVVEPLYNAAGEREVADAVGEAYDTNEGFTDVTTGIAGALIDNPDNVAQIATVSLPHMMALAKKGITSAAASVGLVSDRYTESLEIFKKEYKREPTAEEKAVMLGTATASTVIEVGVSRSILNPDRIPGVGKLKAFEKLVEKVPLAALATKGLGSAAEEFVQESSAAILTQYGGLQDIGKTFSDENTKEFVVQGSLGAGAGGFTGAGVGVASTAQKIAEASIQRSEEAEVKYTDYRYVTGIKSTTAFTDEVVQAAMEGNDDPEVIDNLAAQGIKNIERIENRLESDYETKQINIDERKRARSEINVLRNQLEDLIRQNKVNRTKATKEQAEQAQTEFEVNPTPETASNAASSVVEEVGNDFTTDPEKVVRILGSEEFQAAIDEGAVDPKVAERANNIKRFYDSYLQLLGGTDTPVNAQKRAQRKGRSIEEVHDQIINGSQGWRGIKDALTDLNRLIETKDRDGLATLLESINRFRKQHKEKLDRPNNSPRFIENIQREQKALSELVRLIRSEGIRAFGAKTEVTPEVQARVDAFIQENPLEVTPEAATTESVQEPVSETTSESVEESVTKTTEEKTTETAETTEAVETVESLQAIVAADPRSELEANKPLVEKINQWIERKAQRGDLPSIEEVNKHLNRMEEAAEAAAAAKAQAADVQEETQTGEEIDEVVEEEVEVKEQSTIEKIRNQSTVSDAKSVIAPVIITEDTINKLITAPNFFEKLKDPKQVKKLLKGLTDSERVALGDIYKLYAKFNALLNKTRTTTAKNGTQYKMGHLLRLIAAHNRNPKKAPAFTKGDMAAVEDALAYLITEDASGKRSLDSNIVGALAVAAYSWIGLDSQSTLYRDLRDVAGVLGYREDIGWRGLEHAFNTKFKEDGAFYLDQVISAGTLQSNVVRSIGKDARKLLGLKIRSIDTTKDVKGQRGTLDGALDKNLEVSLGQLAVALLLEADVVVQNDIPSKLWEEMLGPEIRVREDRAYLTTEKSVNFLRLKLADETQLDSINPFIAEMSTRIKEGTKVVSKLFGKMPRITGPTSDIQNVPSYKKGTFQKVPVKALDILRDMNSVKWAIKPGLATLTQAIGKETLLKKLGHSNDDSKIHVQKKLGVKGEMRRIEAETEHLFSFLASTTAKSPFHFAYEMWKNGRVGIISNTFNPQTSKLHRIFIHPENKNGEATVTIAKGQNATRDLFKVAIAQAFGFKIDKNSLQDSIAEGDRLIKELLPTAKRIQQLLKMDINQDIAAKNELNQIIQELPGGVHGLDAILELGSYRPRAAFETTLMIETDGITNGPIIGLLQSAIQDEPIIRQKLNAGGMYFNGEGEFYSEWRQAPQHIDNYEHLVLLWEHHLPANSDSVRNLLGDFVTEGTINEFARDLAKGPLMTVNYGAGLKSVIAAFETEVLSIILNKIETIAAIKNSKMRYQAWADLNKTLMAAFNAEQNVLPNTNDPQEMLSTYIAPQLVSVAVEGYSNALRKALKSYFDDFIAYRNLIQDSTDAMFQMFNTVYSKKIEQLKEQKVKYYVRYLNRKVARNIITISEMDALLEKYEATISDKEQRTVLEELKNLLPIIQTPFSTNLDNGLLIIKFESATSQEKGRSNQQSYSGELKGTKGKTSNKTQSSFKVPASGGVSGGPLSVHSLDASIILEMLSQYNALNIHDAGLYRLDEVLNGTREYNKQFFELNKNYSILNEFGIALARVREEYLKINGDHDQAEIATQLLATMRIKAAGVKKARESLFDNITSVSQAALDQANYVPANLDTKDEAELDFIIAELVKGLRSTKIHEELAELLADPTKRDLGSDRDTLDLEDFVNAEQIEVTASTASKVFEKLQLFGSKVDSSTHSAYLKKIMSQIVEKGLKGIEAIEVRLNESAQDTLGRIQVTEDAKGQEKQRVYLNASTGPVLAGNMMSAQEAYVHEMLHSVLGFAIDHNRGSRKELLRLFKIARAHLTIDDFRPKDADGNTIIMVDEKAEIERATQRYNYIFKQRTLNNTSLHEFAAIALSNEYIQHKLKTVEIPASVHQSKNIWEAITEWFLTAMNWIHHRVYNTTGTTVDAALRNWAEHAVSITQKKQRSLGQWAAIQRTMNGVTADLLGKLFLTPLRKGLEKGSRANNVIGRAISALSVYGPDTASEEVLEILEARKEYLETTKALNELGAEEVRIQKQIVQRKIDRVNSNQHFSYFHEAMDTVLSRAMKMKVEIVSTLAREFREQTAENSVFYWMHRRSNKMIDQARKHTANMIQRSIRAGFIHKYTEEESKSYFHAILKTDLTNLTDITNVEEHSTKSVDEIVELLEDDKKLKQEIETLRTYIKGKFPTVANYYLRQTENLAHLMVFGTSQEENPMRNTYNIARGVSLSGDFGLSIQEYIIAEQMLDRLATLIAIKKTSKHHRNVTVTMIKRENESDPVDNGFIRTMNVAAGFKSRSLKHLFKGNKIHMIKGYVHNTYDPTIDVKIAPLGDEQALQMQGYVRVSDKPLPTDDDFAETGMYMYVSHTSAMNTFMKETMSLTNKSARGTTLSDLYHLLDSNNPEALKKWKAEIKARKSRKVDQQFRSDKVKYDGKIRMIPLLDDRGNIMDYRYEMSEDHKTNLLKRDERFDVVLGKMYGSITDKVNSEQINSEMIHLLKKDYDESKADKIPDDRFVTIGPNSTDPELAELYSLLPDSAKRLIKQVWGGNEITVRKDVFRMVFGYRKFSLTNTGFVRSKPALQKMVRMIENIIYEMTQIAKVNIVIKNPAVLFGNAMSNMVLSFVKGVPIDYMVKEQANAAMALTQYQTDLDKRDRLQLRLDSYKNLTPKQKERLEIEISQLNAELKQNPISKLVDEGIFQSIIEDVDVEENLYGLRGEIEKFAKPILNSMPNALSTVGKHLYMTQDTPAFKLLLKTTQYSDFVARYALWKYRTEVEGIASDVALNEAIETFINYDLPTSKTIQYMNDMGMFMFTKFLFRIQHVILRIFREQPASALSVMALQKAFGDVSDIPDSTMLSLSWINRLQLPGSTYDDVLTVPAIDFFNNLG